MNLGTYLIAAIIFFLLAIVYFFSTHHANDKKLSVGEKIIYSVVTAILAPLLLFGALTFLGIGISAHGG